MSKIRPLGKDVLLKFKTTETTNLTEGGIYVKDDDSMSNYEFYTVEAVGPDVTVVSVGDTVIMTWAKITPPFKHEGDTFGVTSENEIWAVVDV